MTENVQTQDAKPAEAAAPANAETTQTQDHPGRKYVDTSKLPPEVREEVEARINYLAGKAKWTENALKDLAAQNQRLEDAVNKQAEDRAKAEAEQTVSRLEQQKVDAYHKADFEAVARIDSELIGIKAKPPEPARAVDPPATLSPSELATVETWSNEVGENGQFVRPWAVKGHPQFQVALNKVAELSQDQRYVNAPIETILQEVERRMRPQASQPRPTAATVLNGNGAIRPQKTDVTLSPQEERVAINMFKRSGLAKTDDEAIAIYKRQKQAIGGQR